MARGLPGADSFSLVTPGLIQAATNIMGAPGFLGSLLQEHEREEPARIQSQQRRRGAGAGQHQGSARRAANWQRKRQPGPGRGRCAVERDRYPRHISRGPSRFARRTVPDVSGCRGRIGTSAVIVAGLLHRLGADAVEFQPGSNQRRGDYSPLRLCPAIGQCHLEDFGPGKCQWHSLPRRLGGTLSRRLQRARFQ